MLVSAVMITGKNSSRKNLARAAIRCFKEQSYKESELIIVNTGEEFGHELKYPVSSARIREVLIANDRRLTLGDLRNIGLKMAEGDLIIQWDDDDWYSSERIETQIAALQDAEAVLLKRQVRCTIISGVAYEYRRDAGIHGTILHRNIDRLEYPSAWRGEDSALIKSFRHVKVIDCNAMTYIRFFHGTNTWDEYHIMGGLSGSALVDRSSTACDEARALDQILLAYYPEYAMSLGRLTEGSFIKWYRR